MSSPVEKVAWWSNWFCRRVLMFPKVITDNDRVLHHQTATPQTLFELTCTLAVHATTVVVATTVVDVAIVQPLTRFLQSSVKPWYVETKRGGGGAPKPDNRATTEVALAEAAATGAVDSSAAAAASAVAKKVSTDPRKVSWFLLHAAFNSLLTYVSLHEAVTVLARPTTGCYSPARWHGTNPGGLFGACAIGAFHLHHAVAYRDLLSADDIIHHSINVGLGTWIGVYCPWGSLLALSSLHVCGYPGGIVYAALYLQKLGFLTRVQYKRVARYMNLLARMPGQLFANYVWLLSALDDSVRPETTLLTRAAMVFGIVTHTANVLYYADAVVGAYHLEFADEAVRGDFN